MTGAVVGLMALTSMSGGVAYADPAVDSTTNLTELHQQSEKLAESIHAAKADLDKKIALLGAADAKHTADVEALNAAQAQLVSYQGAVDRSAAAVYMGGRTDGLTAILTSASPKNLIDKLAIQRLMATEMAAQMKSFRVANQEAKAMEAASAESAVTAKVTVDEAVAVRADLQRKQSELQKQITEAKIRYLTLPSAEQAALAPSPAVIAALGLANPVPTVGMGGLIPNARALAAYVMSTYPGVQSIGGVRSDPIPDHPSGHAIDIMLSDMALGDVINADIQANAARFNVRYTMWRVPAHFNHIHVTVD
ncbi:MAG: hypothetical protein KIH64_014920 [Mycobacterium sp.]|nr:hypothetical protein [Mycobacterium sp.]